ERAGAQRVDQRHGVPLGGETSEKVLPVVPCSLQCDQAVARLSQEAEQLFMPAGILTKLGGAHFDLTMLVHGSNYVRLRSDVDPDKTDALPSRREAPGASGPLSLLPLVHARPPATTARPLDTVRALNTGRGRHSHGRGHSLKERTATLSRN